MSEPLNYDDNGITGLFFSHSEVVFKCFRKWELPACDSLLCLLPHPTRLVIVLKYYILNLILIITSLFVLSTRFLFSSLNPQPHNRKKLPYHIVQKQNPVTSCRNSRQVLIPFTSSDQKCPKQMKIICHNSNRCFQLLQISFAKPQVFPRRPRLILQHDLLVFYPMFPQILCHRISL